MNGREYFHESVVRDIVDVLTSLKDYDEVQFLQNSSNHRSFKSITSRDLFIKEHCKIDKGQIVLLHDVPFDSPSGASGFVLGRPSNGWDDWKDAEGKKLSEIVKR